MDLGICEQILTKRAGSETLLIDSQCDMCSLKTLGKILKGNRKDTCFEPFRPCFYPIRQFRRDNAEITVKNSSSASSPKLVMIEGIALLHSGNAQTSHTEANRIFGEESVSDVRVPCTFGSYLLFIPLPRIHDRHSDEFRERSQLAPPPPQKG